MDLLTERLKARGYQCNCEMQTRECIGEDHVSGIGQVLAVKELQLLILIGADLS